MKRSPLKNKSNQQAIRDALWQRIKIARFTYLANYYEVPICEYCGRLGFAGELGILDAHHIDKNRRNNTDRL